MKAAKLIPSLVLCHLLSILSVPAFAEDVKYRKLLHLNISNIQKVENGMTESQVRKTMGDYTSSVKDGALGNPWKVENVGNTKILHYLVRRNPPFMPIMEQQANPVILKNGKVTAIGRTFLRDARNSASGAKHPATSSSRAPTKTVEQRLNKLNRLYKSGAIDEQTFKQRQAKILDEI